MNFLTRNKPLIIILVLAVFFRLIYFFTILIMNPDGFYEHDSFQYLTLARNIIQNGTFSQMSSPPYIPDPYRTPLYPIFLSVIPGGGIMIILTQIILSSFTCWLAYSISVRIFRNRDAGFIAGTLVAVDVPSIIYSNSIMTETLFTFLLLVSVYFLINFITCGYRIIHLVLSAVFMGFAILCRPIGLYLPLLIIPALVIVLIKNKRESLIPVGAYAGVVFLALVPWYLRNYEAFKKPFISLLGEVNLCNFHGASVYSKINNMEFYAARKQFWQEQEKKYPRKIEEDVTGYTSFIAGQSVKLMAKHPQIAVQNHLTGIFHLLLKPSRGDIERQTGIRKGFHSISGTKNGFSATIFSLLFTESSFPVLIMVFIQWIYLLILYAGAAYGICLLVKQKQYFILTVLMVIILYFVNMTLPPITYARFRMPLIPLLAILSAAGLMMMMNHRIFDHSRG